MNEIIREEAIREVQFYTWFINRDKYLEQVVNKIYNDHEAQLKLASDVYSTDKMHMYQELKAKDEEIRRLNNLYANTIKDSGDMLMEIERLKEELKAKDEEIRRLNNLYANAIKELRKELGEAVMEIDRLNEAYTAITNNFECALMEIDRLKEKK